MNRAARCTRGNLDGFPLAFVPCNTAVTSAVRDSRGIARDSGGEVGKAALAVGAGARERGDFMRLNACKSGRF